MNWRWIIAVSLLAALWAGYSAFLRRDGTADTGNNSVEQPGYYLTDAVVTQSNDDGSPGITLVSKRIEQRQREDQITLIDVHVDYQQTPEQLWSLSAKRAVVPRDSRIVQFTGDVELRPKNSADNTYLRTQALTVDTARNLAYNDSPVEMRLGPYLLKAQRIDVDLRREKIGLRKVSGRSIPPAPRASRRRE